MAWIAALAALAGTAASTYGASQSARSANSAASEARNFNTDEIARQRGNLGAMMFGANDWAALMDPQGNYSGDPSKTSYSKDRHGQNVAYTNYTPQTTLDQQNAFTQKLGGNFFDQFKGLNTEAAQKAGQVPGMYASQTKQLMGDAGRYVQNVGQTYDAGQGMLAGAGAARKGVINRDAGLLENEMRQKGAAGLFQSGFGNSTAMGNNAAGAARQAGFMRQDQLANLDDALRGQKLDLFKTGAAAKERALSDQVQFGRGRADNQFNLQQADISNQLKYKSAPLSFAWNALSGPNLAPYGDQSGSLPVPGYSPTGVAASTAGNAAAGMGSMLLLQSLMQKGGYGGQGQGAS